MIYKLRQTLEKHQKLCVLLGCFILLTLFVQPGRSFVAQDDAAYAAQAISYSKGLFQPHPAVFALALPQTLVGAFFIKTFAFLPPLVVLTSLTWIVFWVGIVLVLSALEIPPILGLSLFLFPSWLQYGASFLYDVYLGLLVILILSQSARATVRDLDGVQSFFSIGLSFLIVLQQQSWGILPFAIGLMALFQRRISAALSFILGSIVGLLFYHFIPHSVGQQGMEHYWIRSGFQVEAFAFSLLQLGVGFGLFLLPLARRAWSLPQVLITGLVQVGLGWLLWRSSAPILAVGVFFSDYLPRILSAGLISCGVWGWVGASDLLPRKIRLQDLPLWGAVGVLLFLCALRQVVDLRYTLLFVLVFLWIIQDQLQGQLRAGADRIGNSWYFLIPWAVLSLFLNRYNLDTVQARWEVARGLEASGVSANQISAGYGRDHFQLEASCIQKAYFKFGQPQVQDPVFYDKIYSGIPRLYSRDWIPHYVIKPYQVFGQVLSLRSNPTPGQGLEPTQVYPYSSLGLPLSLAVYENQNSRLAECFSSE